MRYNFRLHYGCAVVKKWEPFLLAESQLVDVSDPVFGKAFSHQQGADPVGIMVDHYYYSIKSKDGDVLRSFDNLSEKSSAFPGFIENRDQGDF